MPDGSVGLYFLPRPGEPESNLEPGMSVIKPLGSPGAEEIVTIAPHASTVDTSGPNNTLALQQPATWVYDFDPATGVSRASFAGEVNSTGGGSSSYTAIGVNGAPALAGGVNFGNVNDSSNTSTTNHLTLATGYGIGITTNRMNLVAPTGAQIVENVNNTDVFTVTGTQVNTIGTIPLQAGSGTGNSIRLTPQAAGSPPTFNVISGGDANVGLTINCVGTGGVVAAGTSIQAQTQLISGTVGGTNAGLTIQTAAGNSRPITFNTGSLGRWRIQANNTAEGGSNSGSNFEIDALTDAGGALSTPLSITRSSGAVAIMGSNTNDNANAGYVGEAMISTVLSGSAISLTNAVGANITSLNLTPGDWDIWGQINFLPGATTTIGSLQASLSTVSATAAATPAVGALANMTLTFTTGASQIMPVGPFRTSISATTTWYLVAAAAFGVSTMQGFGFLQARRRR